MITQDMSLTFSKLDRSSALDIVTWRYPSPYEIYNLDADENSIRYALDPVNNFYSIWDNDHCLVGFCSFGQDAQVPGGNYSQDALDIGMGIHPDLTGQGLGATFAGAVMAHARRLYTSFRFRVTIAEFNQRARRVWLRKGFHPIQHFTHQESKRDFVVLVCELNEKQSEGSLTP